MPLSEISTSQLRQRKLWHDHIVQTRMLIISFGRNDKAGVQKYTSLLMKNQEDIGHEFSKFGLLTPFRITGLLKEHIMDAAGYLKAAYMKSIKDKNKYVGLLTTNVGVLAMAISSCNPKVWHTNVVNQLLMGHILHTKESIDSRVKGDWAGDQMAWLQIQGNINQIADALASGL